MKFVVRSLLVTIFQVLCHAQAASDDISPTQLQTILSLPLNQAVKQREVYKVPLKSAYDRQNALRDKDCQAQSDVGQQPYNVCMGEAAEQADKDLAIFYRNLQMLCHGQDELTTLQTLHKTWLLYKESAMKAAHAAWPDGTGAPGFAAQVYLSSVRDHMRELREIYGLNISQ